MRRYGSSRGARLVSILTANQGTFAGYKPRGLKEVSEGVWDNYEEFNYYSEHLRDVHKCPKCMHPYIEDVRRFIKVCKAADHCGRRETRAGLHTSTFAMSSNPKFSPCFQSSWAYPKTFWGRRLRAETTILGKDTIIKWCTIPNEPISFAAPCNSRVTRILD